MIVVAATVLNALWQDAFLVMCVWLLMRAMPHINAATRYVVWSATLVAAIVVPVATTLAFFAPAQTVAQRSAVHSAASGPAVQTRSHTLQARPANTLPQAAAPAPSTTSATERALASLPQRMHVTMPMPVAIGVFAAWALLAAYALAGLLLGLWRLERLKRDALPLPVEYRDSMPQWVEANKGRRPVRLCVSDDIDVPVAVGLFDAMILIPRPLLERLSPAEVEQISMHELAHLRRADDWSNCLQRVIVAALGWNPAALFVAQQLELEREVACDDWVLSSVGGVRPYALCLTKMAETAAWPHHPMPAPGVFTTRKQISLRIERLLGSGRNIATSLAIGPTAAAIAAVSALALLIAFVAPSVAAPSGAEPAVGSVEATHVITRTPPKSAQAVTQARASAKPAVVTKFVYLNVNGAAQTLARTAAPAVRASARAAARSVEGDSEAIASSAASSAIDSATRASAQAGELGDSISKSVDSMVQGTIAKAIKRGVGASALASDGKSCVGCDLHGVNWSGRDLRGANYTGVDFSGANLSNVNLSGSMLNGTDFSHANLSGISFRNAHLTGCDFTNANLTGADFTGAWMSGCEFKGARLQSAQLRSILNGCKGCDFAYADLSGSDLSGVKMNGDDFSHADLRNANFSGAELVGTDFSKARLDGANFSGATLNGCDLGGVDLTHVDLSKAKLIGMDFSKRDSPP